MAGITYAQLQAALNRPSLRSTNAKISMTTAIGSWEMLWFGQWNIGGYPPTSVSTVCDKATVGAAPYVNPPSGKKRFLAGVVASGSGVSAPVTIMLVDRLNHNDDLVANITTTQTTPALPTATLTRYTNGVGVVCSLEVNLSQTGTGGVCRINYTDADLPTPTTAQVSCDIPIGTAANSALEQDPVFPVAIGDTGITIVESFKSDVDTTSAGAAASVMWKPLAMFQLPIGQDNNPRYIDSFIGMGGQLPEIVNDACLAFRVLSGAGSTGLMQMELLFVDEP